MAIVVLFTIISGVRAESNHIIVDSLNNDDGVVTSSIVLDGIYDSNVTVVYANNTLVYNFTGTYCEVVLNMSDLLENTTINYYWLVYEVNGSDVLDSLNQTIDVVVENVIDVSQEQEQEQEMNNNIYIVSNETNYYAKESYSAEDVAEVFKHPAFISCLIIGILLFIAVTVRTQLKDYRDFVEPHKYQRDAKGRYD